ncbi:helix-turn-helix transcriptional regulator [Catellatospora sichuanensis]|uniref:helix-turn-helix transcriptional regulator n=1 Tax=Catellatospora sichuanensis TaxID=1969805 RepID=UPI0011832970|nr:helix-turn-helix transcriptional regulator [Catellatospora sichuanensis]
MDRRQAAELLRERTGRSVAPRLLEQLLRRTDADPTVLAAIADQVDGDGDGLHRLPLRWPEELAEPVRAALRSLEPGARETVTAAAVIGREFDLAILEGVCPGQDVLSGLDDAAAAGLVREQGPQVYGFVRALDREVCYDTLGARSRAALHERVAGVLTRLGALGGTRAATLPELAHHTAEAAALGGPARLDAAVAASATAAAAADEEGAYDLAAGYFAQAALFAGRAGWTPPQAGRLLAASGTARLRGAGSAAAREAGRASLTGALRLGLRAGDLGLIAAAALGLGPRSSAGALAGATAVTGSSASAGVSSGAAPVGSGAGSSEGAEVRQGAAVVPPDPVRVAALRDACAALPAVGLPPEQHSAAARLMARLAGELGQAELAERALDLARAAGDPRAVAEALLAVGGRLDEVVREAAALNDAELQARAYDLAAADALRHGDRVRAAALLARAAALGEGRPTALVRWYALRAAAELAALRGRPDPAAADRALAAGQLVDPAAAEVADRALRGWSGLDAGPGGLTSREREVLVWALRGAPAKEIASGLVLGERTVETHLASIYRKLGVRTRIELIKKLGDGSSP